MSYIKHIPVKANFISVAWYIGSVCNYRCFYCRPEYHDGKVKFPNDYNDFSNFISKLREKDPDRKIFLTMYGGEVALWKEFDSFLDYCKENQIAVRLITNGSRSIDWWKRNIHKIYSLIISYHHEFATEDHVTEVMKLTASRGQVNLLIPPDHFDEVVEIGKRISENAKVFVIPKFLRVDMTEKLYPYTPKQLEFFQTVTFGVQYANANRGYFKYSGFLEYKDDGKIERYTNTRQIYLQGLNRWQGWKCWGGIDSFYIDYKSDVFAGQCKRGLMFNLKDDYELSTEPFICDKMFCNCSQDMMDSRKEKV